jgi:hypothetical protein
VQSFLPPTQINPYCFQSILDITKSWIPIVSDVQHWTTPFVSKRGESLSPRFARNLLLVARFCSQQIWYDSQNLQQLEECVTFMGVTCELQEDFVVSRKKGKSIQFMTNYWMNSTLKIMAGRASKWRWCGKWRQRDQVIIYAIL